MIEIETICVTPFMQNARVLACTRTNEAVVIDPGGEAQRIYDFIKKKGYNLKAIWLTHSHLDHIGGVKKLLELHPMQLVAHPDEAFMRSSVVTVARMYGIPDGAFENCREPDVFIKGGETLKVGEVEFQVLFTPGHSPGHVSLYCKNENLVIAGDVLFAGAIGRTDLPGGDYETLLRSVREKLFTLPGKTKVLCGHGGDTTIEQEMRTNPFFVGANER